MVAGKNTEDHPKRSQPRHFRLPDTAGGKLWVWRYLMLRRLTQFLILLLLFGTARWGWKVGGLPVLRGNLSASEFLGMIPLADPFATLQILLTGHMLDSRVLIGAIIVLSVFCLLGGRVFCSWVCPVNPVADLAGWLRGKLDLKQTLRMSNNIRYWVLGLALVLSSLLGVAAFEWISPIGMLHREVIFGMGSGWMAVLAILTLDLLVLERGWCGHLCPLGALYGLIGRAAQVRVAFDASTCTRCGDCIRICHEPQVLDFRRAAEVGMIDSGDCTNCGRCVPICPEDSLGFGWRSSIRAARSRASSSPARRGI